MQLRKGRVIVFFGVAGVPFAFVLASELSIPSTVQSESPAVVPGSSMSLFMSVEEQRAAEKRNSQTETDGMLPAEPLDTEELALDNEAVTEEESEANAPVDGTNLLKAERALPRYDGVVLRNGAVLGLWVNAQRLSTYERTGSVRFESVRANGQASFSGALQVSGNTGTVVLNPGDLMPFKSNEVRETLQSSKPDSSVAK